MKPRTSPTKRPLASARGPSGALAGPTLRSPHPSELRCGLPAARRLPTFRRRNVSGGRGSGEAVPECTDRSPTVGSSQRYFSISNRCPGNNVQLNPTGMRRRIGPPNPNSSGRNARGASNLLGSARIPAQHPPYPRHMTAASSETEPWRQLLSPEMAGCWHSLILLSYQKTIIATRSRERDDPFS
jgi:hypothetical protein